MRRTIVKMLGAAVAIGAAGIASLLAFAFLPTLFGAEALIVTSGSMGDSMPVGSVAVTRLVDANAVAVGDVITFRGPGARTSITHRVIGARHEGEQRVFATKGDANPAADAEPVRVSDRVHRVERVVPYAGQVVRFARTPAGGVALILIPILGLLADRRRRGRATAEAAPAPAAVEAPQAPVARAARSVEPIAIVVGGFVLGMIAFRLAGRPGRKRPRLAG
jgi:signal peptidase I